jgi:hypothetical protein
MPNWCFNKLIVTGPDIPALLNAIGTQDQPFSFDKVIPMPECIKIMGGQHIDMAVAAAISISSIARFEQIASIVRSYCTQSPFGVFRMDAIAEALENEDRMMSLFAKMYTLLHEDLAVSDMYSHIPADQDHPLTVEELASIGDQYLENIVRYGALNGYEWAGDNWGTKWDLDDSTEVILQDEHALILEFDTAWTSPKVVIIQLGKCFPEYKFRLTWHEPSNGYQGRLDVFGQVVTHTVYEQCSERRLTMDLGSKKIPARLQWKSK